ncbi:MAG: helix-turn-helix domain-containing protein [Cellulosilyticaceae bacterium]
MMDGQDKALITLLKSKQHQKQLSLRKISHLSGIDVSTLSRLFNGKQKPQMKHLEKLSEVLELSLSELLRAAGYGVDDIHGTSVGVVNPLDASEADWFGMCEVMEGGGWEAQIQKDLEGYSQYMQVNEGPAMIENNLEAKLKSVGQIGPVIDRIKEMYAYFTRPDTALMAYILIGSGLLYFIVAADVIPDFIFPLGFVDDTIAIKLVWDKVQQFL